MFGPQSCATVAIQLKKTEDNPTGIVVINESDFDPDTMIKAEPANPSLAPAVPVEPPPPAETGEKKVVAPWAA